MEITVRSARTEDAHQMLKVYRNFSKQFVGLASRTLKPFRRMLRKKENINWVAVDSQNRIIGYVHARIEKRINRGEFREVVVEPRQDFEQIAKLLVEKVHAIFMEKNVAAIDAGSVRNPVYEELFPKLGFFESESTGVFMYAILDVKKFLNELSPVFISRLNHVENWNGIAQIECEGHSIFLQKNRDSSQQIVWTNQPAESKVKLNKTALTKLIFGRVHFVECLKTGELEIEEFSNQEMANQLLKALFPEKPFLIMDYW